MAGKFEVFLDADSRIRVRLVAPDGTLMALSGVFEDRSAVAAGIAAIRECAGTGLVTDLRPSAKAAPPAPVVATAQLEAACADQRVPAPRVHNSVISLATRRRVATPHWT